MFPDEKKINRLINVARMYYDQDMSQSEVSKIIGVSRPMVSKLLAEAKKMGIVTIKINEIKSVQQVLREKLIEYFNLENVIIVETLDGSLRDIDIRVASVAYTMVTCEKNLQLGIGCGSVLGQMCEYSQQNQKEKINIQGDVFPLIGGFKASYRSYHTNELARSLGETTGLNSSYMYLPALVDTYEEKKFFKKTELYADIEKKWVEMDKALVNISNLYSTPDLATSIRFGKRLIQQKAVGRFLAYYYDVNGKFIDPEQDNVMQIDIEYLKKSKEVIALCAEKVEPQSAVGALRTGVFTNVILSDIMARKIIDFIDDELQK